MNWRIVRALIIKYVFFCSRNTFRLLDVFFWPVMDLLIWGFVTAYMLKVSHAVPTLITFFIAATIFWNVLFRAQQVVSVSFLDDVWSKNLLNIFASPARPVEYVGAAYMLGLAQALVILVLLGGLACLFCSFNIFTMGLTCAFLFVNLLFMGWWLGLIVTGCILRWGPPAEALAWAAPFLIQPLSAVFYPVSVLPAWLQGVAMAIPSTHVFEGMRQFIEYGHIDASYLWCALGLNIVYAALSAKLYCYFFEQARKRGFLAKYAV